MGFLTGNLKYLPKKLEVEQIILLIVQKTKIQYNTQQIGLIAGLVVPLFVIIGFYNYRNVDSVSAFIDNIVYAGIFSELVSLCVVPNLLLFFIFMWTNRLKSARGVISATFIYAFVVIGLKFFL